MTYKMFKPAVNEVTIGKNDMYIGSQDLLLNRISLHGSHKICLFIYWFKDTWIAFQF